MKRFIVFLLFLFLFQGAFVYSAPAKDVAYIPPRQYFDILIQEIKQAQSSITVCMYLFSVFVNRPDSEPFQIVQSLAQAAKRGVKVRVILDRNIRFSQSPQMRSWDIEGKNRTAFDLFQKSGIAVYYDHPRILTHAKIIVIDGSKVILGSTNWTKTAFDYNYEGSVLIHSAPLAEEILQDIEKIITKSQTSLIENNQNLRIPGFFIEDKTRFSRMVTKLDHRSFDIYLYLLQQQLVQKSPHFYLDLQDLAESLGISHMKRTSYRQQILKVLKKLDNRYALLKMTAHFGKDPEIFLLDLRNPQKSYQTPTHSFVLLSADYWKYEWNQKLSFAEKAFYLINLYHLNSSPNKINWSLAAKTISRIHDVSPHFIYKGSVELRRKNLLDVKHSPLSKHVTQPRKPNIYTPLPLYNHKTLAQQFHQLEQQHGSPQFNRAKKIAVLLYKDSDIKAVEHFMRLENEYGLNKIKQALKILGAKNPDNPKRCVGYFINTVKNLK